MDKTYFVYDSTFEFDPDQIVIGVVDENGRPEQMGEDDGGLQTRYLYHCDSIEACAQLFVDSYRDNYQRIIDKGYFRMDDSLSEEDKEYLINFFSLSRD